MKVLKFGGTSVGTVDALLKVKEIVGSQTDNVIVVVSALGGVTNQLIAMTDLAVAKDASWETMLRDIDERHRLIIRAVVPVTRQAECEELMDLFINQSLAGSLGMITLNDVPADVLRRMRVSIVNLGEVMSSVIVTAMLDARADFAPEFIKTHYENGENVVDLDTTYRLVREHFAYNADAVRVTQGFISHDTRNDEIDTNLGRGGSDLTAAIIAAALDARSLEIWTDVDGFLTADPRIAPNARLIERMSYDEARELCDAGAKVLYYPSVKPVQDKKIDTWIKNTFNPVAPGTLISESGSAKAIVGVTSKDRTVTFVARDGVDLAFTANELMLHLMQGGVAAAPMRKTANSVTMQVVEGDVTTAVRLMHDHLFK